jgi:hypothetical protein
MRMLRHSTLLGLLCVCGLAAADGGLKVSTSDGFWSGVQSKLHFSAAWLEAPTLADVQPQGPASAERLPLAASVGGDYYFSKDLAAAGLPPSGFRASGALLIRQPGVSLSGLAWQSRAVTSLAAPLRLSNAAGPGISAMPYLGIGYSDYSLKSGWGFWADIGLVVQSPGSVLGMGRVMSGSQSVDDLMHELRMSPLLQLGINYSF